MPVGTSIGTPNLTLASSYAGTRQRNQMPNHRSKRLAPEGLQFRLGPGGRDADKTENHIFMIQTQKPTIRQTSRRHTTISSEEIETESDEGRKRREQYKDPVSENDSRAGTGFVSAGILYTCKKLERPWDFGLRTDTTRRWGRSI